MANKFAHLLAEQEPLGVVIVEDETMQTLLPKYRSVIEDFYGPESVLQVIVKGDLMNDRTQSGTLKVILINEELLVYVTKVTLF